MKAMIGWLVAVVIIGLIVYLIERLFTLDPNFKLVFRVMCGIIAFVCFICFLLELLKFAGLPLPW